MKNLKILSAIIILLLANYSCSNEEIDLIPSQTIITMEGDGGIESITIETGDWRIVGIINRNGNQNIFGEISDKEGKLIKENSLLELDGLGKLDATWMDKGFNIYRKTINSLQIELYENTTGEEFNFNIIIEIEGRIKEIFVNQKISRGYDFESIEYYLTKDDKDSLYFKENIGYIHNNIPKPSEVEIYPFRNSANIMNRSYFMSDNSHAFMWFKENYPKVKVPSFIKDGEVYLSNEEHTYGEVYENWNKEYDTKKKKVSIPAGKSKFHVGLEWRNRQVSYRMIIKNKRTGEIKEVEGKWLETTPTGEYTIIREY